MQEKFAKLVQIDTYYIFFCEVTIDKILWTATCLFEEGSSKPYGNFSVSHQVERIWHSFVVQIIDLEYLFYDFHRQKGIFQ